MGRRARAAVRGEERRSLSDGLKKVVGGARLSAGEMTTAFNDIVDGKGTDAQIAGFAIALRMRGDDAVEHPSAPGVMRRARATVPLGVRG